MSTNTDSILNSVKRIVGVSVDDDSFDDELVMHINTVFMTLQQIGVVDNKWITIDSSYDSWDDFLSDDMAPAIKTYMGLKVRSIFDPPTSSAVKDALNANLQELEWRLYILADNRKAGGTTL